MTAIPDATGKAFNYDIHKATWFYHDRNSSVEIEATAVVAKLQVVAGNAAPP